MSVKRIAGTQHEKGMVEIMMLRRLLVGFTVICGY
jgi:hypothetical protein